MAREALRVPVDAQIDFRGDRALLLRSGNGTTGCAGDDGESPEARRRVEGEGTLVDGRRHGGQRAVEGVVDVGPGLRAEGDGFTADEGSRARAEEHRQRVRLAGARRLQTRRVCEQDES